MGTPALVVEVLSESTRSKDMIKTGFIYAGWGGRVLDLNPLSERDQCLLV